MLSYILTILIASQISVSKGEDILNQMANRYKAVSGIQWTMQSRLYQPIFDDTQNSPVLFTFNAPDTFYYKSDNEEVLGIADTIWVLSRKNKQIQKKLTESYLMPTDFIIKWKQHYTLKDYQTKSDVTVFGLLGNEGVSPANVKLTLDKNNRIKEIYYKDISDNDVTLTITKETLKRSQKINLFFINIPKGYKLIDLIE
jgi:outer membrane lipoprotein-sorting protein